MASIHPSAIVSDTAEIGEGCRIGPFCIVGPKVVLGADVELKSHVVISGDTLIGDGTVIFPFAVIGEVPQDKKFDGEETQLRIGARNRIREHVTINTGTAAGGGLTRVGDDGLFLAGCHIAHDAQVGSRVVIVNSAAIAGHCIIEDDVIVGGLCGIHQFVRVGSGAIIGALSMVTADVVPNGLVMGPRGALEGLNLIGLKRRGVARSDIAALRAAFDVLKSGEGTVQDKVQQISSEHQSETVRLLIEFVMAGGDRGLLMPR